MSSNYRRFLFPIISCIIGCSLFVLDQSLQKLGSSGELLKISTPRSLDEGTILTIINTPKCGTGGIEQTFIKSNRCTNPTKLGNVKRISYTTKCQHNTEIVRTHHVDAGAEAIATIRRNSLRTNNRKCVIVTAIRHPESWLPSLFMQRYNNRLCEEEMPYDKFYAIYRNFIVEESSLIRDNIVQVRPKLLKEFGSTLPVEMKRAKENGGYSLLYNNNNGPSSSSLLFPNCELLFLTMEHHENWHDIFAMLYPGTEYEQNINRVEKCPRIADHYLQLKSHKLSEEEKVAIMGGNEDVKEYFHLYGIV